MDGSDWRKEFLQRLHAHRSDRESQPTAIRLLPEVAWNSLRVLILFSRTPTDSDKLELQNFLVGWHSVAGASGFGSAGAAPRDLRGRQGAVRCRLRARPGGSRREAAARPVPVRRARL